VVPLPLSLWDVGPPSLPGIALGYGAIPTDQIDEGLERLRSAFDRH
jgi:DNA-binding transcriptional MocR family regulator